MALLSDVRELIERLRPLGALVLAAYAKQRVAVIDSEARGCPSSEFEARRRGYELRYFGDLSAALAWLHAPRNDA